MKKIINLTVGLLVLTFTPVFGQPSTPSPGVINYGSGQAISYIHPPNKSELTKFNLDFPSGTPAELVKAIEKATGKPLNVIIPDEDANFKLPPLKLHDVTFPQLAQTMRVGSSKEVFIRNGNQNGYATGYQMTTFYDFTTTDNSPTDTSVWFFHVQQAPPKQPIQKVCRFYSLAPYLNRGFKVDDITTAIQTGWKMAGITSPPKLEYHKETKLLIAYGEPSQLQTIEDVLHALPKPAPNLQNTLEYEKKKLSILNSISTSRPPSSIKENSGK